MDTQVIAIEMPGRTPPPIPCDNVNTLTLFTTIGVVVNEDGTVGWMSEAHRLSLGAN